MKLDIEPTVDLQSKPKEFLHQYDKARPLVLYGAGASCVFLVDFLQKNQITPVGIIDSDPKKRGTELCGLPAGSMKEAMKTYPDLEVFISAPSVADEIRRDLSAYLPEERIHYFEYERLFYCEPDDYKEYVRKHEKELQKIYSALADDFSKEVMDGMLRLWCSADPQYLESIYTPNQYFTTDIVHLGEQESFVDCGAFVGDTFEQFKNEVHENYLHYYGFEPQQECFSKLSKACGWDSRNTAIPFGASDRKAQLQFSAGNDGRQATVDDGGDVIINVTTIDEAVKGPVTFIKMDIEGSELEALHGAEQTILKNRPKLAICIYHKAEDIVEIPKYIMSLGLDYQYYIRHHQRYSGTETVFYAV